VQLGHDVEPIIGSAYPSLVSANGILPGSSSKHRLFSYKFSFSSGQTVGQFPKLYKALPLYAIKMRRVLILSFFFLITACRQNKQSSSLITEDLKYTAYGWHLGADSIEFYVAHYLDIDKDGHYILMRHDTFMDKPKYFTGVIPDTVRKQINATLSDTTLKKVYDFKIPNSVIYDGFNYCFDYKNKNGVKNNIQFIPSQSPTEIKNLSTLLDTLIYSTSKTKTQAFNLDNYKNYLNKISLTHPPPRREPPKIEYIKRKKK
jgi:hypothetical protein